MARYTELFSEYLESGGELPSAFDDIEGFEDLFKLYYCDKEIGFETETLFALKLELYAQIYIPIYAERISDLATAIIGARNPAKVIYEKSDIKFTGGEQNASLTELPYTSATSTSPSSKTKNEQYENEDEREVRREESGRSIQEAYFIIDNLNKEVKPLLQELLKEFRHCFMEVF